jgi:hypothetical protein
MTYLVGNYGGRWGAALARAWLAGARCGAALQADFVELHLSCTVARLFARCADPLLRRFDALFVTLVKQGSSSGAGDLHRLRYTAQEDAPEGVQDATPSGCHGAHVPRARWARRAGATRAVPRAPALALAPVALCQGIAGLSPRVAWLCRGKKWSASACCHMDENVAGGAGL